MQLQPTPAGWIEAVMNDFDSFLQDHASCEKKASGMALNIASHYPDQPHLLTAMVDLAVEELTHYREVVRLMLERGIQPGADTRDPYVRSLNELIRRGEHYLLDRLLIAAIVEYRGSERFGLIARVLEDDPLATFYRAITESEARHWQLFIELAETCCGAEKIPTRLAELCELEAELITALPFRAALH
jgi:tRNA-(ms[2]io[6]A)-hydroxylase